VIAPLFGNAAIVLLLAMPLVTMRLISEEHRAQTLCLLFSAPISMSEIVLGKFIGMMGFVFIMIVMIAIMPLSLLLGGNIDFGMFTSGLLGLTLLLASFAAIGLFMSTLTAHPAVAAITSFGALLLLWIFNNMTSGGQEDNFFRELSLLHHFEPLIKGVFDSSDFVYFILFIATFLILSIRKLDSYRLQH
jgi:ABC-2 type transport system permease protein